MQQLCVNCQVLLSIDVGVRPRLSELLTSLSGLGLVSEGQENECHPEPPSQIHTASALAYGSPQQSLRSQGHNKISVIEVILGIGLSCIKLGVSH